MIEVPVLLKLRWELQIMKPRLLEKRIILPFVPKPKTVLWLYKHKFVIGEPYDDIPTYRLEPERYIGRGDLKGCFHAHAYFGDSSLWSEVRENPHVKENNWPWELRNYPESFLKNKALVEFLKPLAEAALKQIKYLDFSETLDSKKEG